MSEFVRSQCEHCKQWNYVYVGDPYDVTRPDVDQFRCWNCEKLTWTTEDPIIKQMAKENGPFIAQGRKILS